MIPHLKVLIYSYLNLEKLWAGHDHRGCHAHLTQEATLSVKFTQKNFGRGQKSLDRAKELIATDHLQILRLPYILGQGYQTLKLYV